jgi:hypothetical protein
VAPGKPGSGKRLVKIMLSVAGAVVLLGGLVQSGEYIEKYARLTGMHDVDWVTVINVGLVVAGLGVLLYVNWPRKKDAGSEGKTRLKDLDKIEGFINSVGRCINQAQDKVTYYLRNPLAVTMDQLAGLDFYGKLIRDVHGVIVSTLGKAEGNAFQKFCKDTESQPVQERLVSVMGYIQGLQARQISHLKQQQDS